MSQTIDRAGARQRPHQRRLPRRHAMLGGTTTTRDAMTALRSMVGAGRLVDGPSIAAYERAFADFVRTEHAISFAAGRVGLYGILRCLGIGAGDEVLLQVPTHIVVPNAIRYAGARPVFVDCELDTYNMDLDAAAARITPRTRALLIQHTFGIPADLARAAELADRHGLYLIEDCVHALGAAYDHRQVGTWGRAAFFSTEETKTISTTMGGIVTTGDAALAERLYGFQQTCEPPSASRSARYLLKLAAYHLLTEPRVHVAARAAYEALGRRHPLPRPTEAAELRGDRPARFAKRLSNGQAAVGLSQLASLSANLAHRRFIADRYQELLAPHGFRLPQPPPASSPAYVRYPVWVADRRAAEQATARRLVLGTWFTSVLEEALDPRYVGYVAGSCPRAEDAARHLVNLPTHARVDEQDAAEFAACLVRSQSA
jgi:perosamine synthetase